MSIFFDRVAFLTDTTGTGTVDVDEAITPSFFTPDEAGVPDAASPIPYLILDGTDVEYGYGTYNTGTPATFSRDTVTKSKIGGTVGTSKINLSGNARVRFTLTAADLDTLSVADGSVTFAKMASGALASFGEFNSATADKILTTVSVWNNIVPLTEAATIDVDFNLGYNFGGSSNNSLGLTGDRILGAPSNPRTGRAGFLYFHASSETRTLTLNSSWILFDGVEVGPYEIVLNESFVIPYMCLGAATFVTAILRRNP